ncbi:MAG TPA: hypothetical protein VMW89_15500 [Desulfatiglandales bacterium]|nr:hypothetical protein [Desulfatiglandales bacterium]
MSDPGKTLIEKLFSSEALLLAGIPLLAYFYTFRYEAGLAKVFGIPLSFIDLDLRSGFIVACAVAFGLAALFFILNLIYVLVVVPFKGEEIIARRIWASFPLLVWFLAELVLFPSLSIRIISPLTALLFVTFFLFLMPLITQRSKGGYLEKLKSSDATDAESESLFRPALKYLGHKRASFLFWLMILLFIVYSAGQAQGMKQKEFFVLASSPNTVVLRIYGDKMICAPFNRGDRKVERSLIIHKTLGNRPLVLKLEEIGPLSLRLPRKAKK